MDVILRDIGISELFVQDKLQRQATFALLRTIVTQIEEVAQRPISRGRLPPDVRIAKLADQDEAQVQLSDGTLCIVNRRTREVTPVFPAGFAVSNYLIINHVVDRGSTNVSLMSFAAHCGMLWSVTWGWFHDLWNSIKAACKGVAQGRWWLMVVRFASIANINHGPFRSGSWGKAKQTALTTYLACRTSESNDFQEAARMTAALHGRDCDSDEDFDYWFQFLSRLPSATSAGPICKFARWLSIQECWEFYRPEMWFLRELLLEMSPQQAAPVAGGTTAMLDAESADKMTTGSGSLLCRAPGYITQELIDVLDMFTIGTKACRRLYSSRAATIKSVETGLAHSLWLVSGGWEDELSDVVRDSLQNRQHLSQISVVGHDDRAKTNSKNMMTFVLRLLTERVIRVMPALLSFPAVSVKLLHPEVDKALEARDEFLDCWRALRETEAEVLVGSSTARSLLGDIFWADHALIRLLFNIMQLESVTHPGRIGPQTLHLANAINAKLPDEKAPEDVHQHIRDCQRARRHKHIQVAVAYDAQIKSGVLESRNVSCPSVGLEAVAHEAWRSLSQKTHSKMKFVASPKDWPTDFNQLLNMRREWPSPAAPGQAQAYLAWSWVVLRCRSPPGERPDLAVAWLSRLAPLHKVMVDQENEKEGFLCLFVGRWGCLGVRLRKVGAATWALMSERGSIGALHLVDPFRWCVVQAEVVLCDSGLVLEGVDQPSHLLRHALLDRRSFTTWELHRAIGMFSAAQPPSEELLNAPHGILLRRLVELVFGDEGEVERVMDLYAKEKEPEPEDEVLDNDMSLLLQEMAMTDQVNIGDLKAWKGDLDRKVINKLNRRRQQDRRERLAAQSAKRKTQASRRAVVKRRAKLATIAAAARKRTAKSRKSKPGGTSCDEAASGLAHGVGAPVVAANAPEAAALADDSSAAQPAPPPPPAPPVAVAHRQPKGGNGWQVLEAPEGGWMRFSETLGRLDAHCGRHDGCKMDRSLKKGPLGLCVAWLATPAADKVAHTELKFVLSQESALQERRLARDRFRASAEVSGGLFQKVLDIELALRGSAEEPASLAAACR